MPPAKASPRRNWPKPCDAVDEPSEFGRPCWLVIAAIARRQFAESLPEAVATAAYEFVIGPLLDSPQRVGKRLHPPLADRHSARRGTYRVIYRIDEEQRTVTVLTVAHRSDAYH